MSVSRSTARMARVERGRGILSTTQVWGEVAVTTHKIGNFHSHQKGKNLRDVAGQCVHNGLLEVVLEESKFI